MRCLPFTLLMFFILSCETVIDVSIETRPAELVITSLFTPETPWRVLVQQTVPTQEVASVFPSTIENATVTIRGDDGSLVALNHKGGGFYHSANSLPRVGVTYTLRVQADGFTAVEAVDRLPVPVIVIDVRTWAATDIGSNRIEIDIQDDAAVRNFYELSVAGNGSGYHEPFTVLNPKLDAQIKELEVRDFLEPDIRTPSIERALIHDGPFDGKKFAFQLEAYGRDRTVYIRTVSKSYYEYHRTRTIQHFTENDPFVEPIMVQSNIRNGHGIFAGYVQHTHGLLSPKWLLTEVSGTWLAASFKAIYDNDNDNKDVDYIANGGSVVITLHPDYTVTGSMQLMEQSQMISLNGGFSLQFGRIRLFHSSDTALRDMEFYFDSEGRSISGQINHPDVRPRILVDFVRG